MTGPPPAGDSGLAGWNVTALKRRVLLAGTACLAAFAVTAYALATSGAPDFALPVALAVIYLLVARPLLAPVRAANRLRKALAYQAYLAEKDADR